MQCVRVFAAAGFAEDINALKPWAGSGLETSCILNVISINNSY